ncbi:MAG: response regulator [Myxococcota bacterium]|nr:response regulator [Myxococcota bacterium]
MTQQMPLKNVLLVDDERAFIDTMAERLVQRGISASLAYCSEDALDRLDAEGIDIVVLDLKMPGMDGMALLSAIKQRHPNIEVIMLTGHGSSKEEATARDLGVFAYLTKPQPIDALTQVIRQADEKRQQ